MYIVNSIPIVYGLVGVFFFLFFVSLRTSSFLFFSHRPSASVPHGAVRLGHVQQGQPFVQLTLSRSLPLCTLSSEELLAAVHTQKLYSLLFTPQLLYCMPPFQHIQRSRTSCVKTDSVDSVFLFCFFMFFLFSFYFIFCPEVCSTCKYVLSD